MTYKVTSAIAFSLLCFSLSGCSGSSEPIVATEESDAQAQAALEAEMKSVEDAEKAQDAQYKKSSKR